MASRGRRLKREATVSTNGLPTPAASATTTIIDDDSPYKVESFASDFPSEQYSDQDRHRRSASLSLRSSRPPPRMSHDIPDFSSLGLKVVGRQVNLLVDAINDLRQVGVEYVKGELPELVLVGDQSAGKSSLMGALAEIHLPRRDGRCTLSPTNIKTSPSNTWHCKVSLEQTFSFSARGRFIDSRHVTKTDPFPEWSPQTLDVKPFKTITQKSELEEVLRWAQIALLNHNQDYKLFIPGSGARCHDATKEEKSADAKFSPNTISVQIAGPGLPALSFFDLPGIFAAAEDPKEQYLVKVFENLAKKYIKHENALIICAIAMKTDPGNSRTSAIISELKATDRCIGVLTMPDRLPAGHAEYENVLRGKAHVVGRGYFVTKQPAGDSTLTEPDYHQKAREEEMQFFENDILWAGKWSEFRGRCGTEAIQKYLSQAFAEQIAASMPKITEKIRYRTTQIDAQLAALPELPASNVQYEIQRYLQSFSMDVQRLMSGESVNTGTDNLKSSWSGLSGKFRDLILHIKPRITLVHEDDKHPRLQEEVIEIPSDDDEDRSPLINRKRPASQDSPFQQGAKRQVNDARIPFAIPATPRHNTQPGKYENSPRVSASPAPSSQAAKRRSGPNPFKGSPFEEFADLGSRFQDLAGIKDTIERHTPSGMANHVDTGVYNELCMLSVQCWEKPLEIFIRETQSMMRNELDRLLLKHLGRYQETELFRQCGALIDAFLLKFETEQKYLIKALYKLETYKFFTINNTSNTENEQKEMKILKASRKRCRARFYVNHQVQLGRKKMPQDIQQNQVEFKKAIDKVTDEELGNDPFENEIRVAASVRGYYITAALRFVDSVCLSINGKLFRDIHDNIFFYLEDKLGIVGPDGEEKCRALMEEDDNVAIRRAYIRGEKEKLTRFADRLNQLAAESGCGDINNNMAHETIHHQPYVEDDVDDGDQVMQDEY